MSCQGTNPTFQMDNEKLDLIAKLSLYNDQ